MLSPEQARALAESLVERARSAGADASDAIYVGQESQGVSVRLGELEHVDRSEGEEIGLRAFIGSRSASVATSDFSREALDALVTRVLAMAAEAPEDPYAGLAPAELLHRGPLPDIDPQDPSDLDPGVLRERALAAERSALAVAGVANSSGGSASTSAGTTALATSGGFSGAYRATGYSCSVSVVAGEGAAMQRDHAWHGARHLEDLEDPKDIGRLAGNRAVARLGPSKPKPGEIPDVSDLVIPRTMLVPARPARPPLIIMARTVDAAMLIPA